MAFVDHKKQYGEKYENPVLDVKSKREEWLLEQKDKLDLMASNYDPDAEISVDSQEGRESFMKVTDKEFYMDGFLKENLDEIPMFLKKKYDCVFIVSGHGKVRLGKSTLASQCGYYVAWLLNEMRKRKGLVPKDNPVPFNNSNVVFDPDTLMKLADKLPEQSVIVYDEGRSGLDSANAMQNINKGMQTFFEECGRMQHVIIVVLPDYFKLSETIAVPRSLFLIDVYTDRRYNRGYFSFYNEGKKELLYVYGKKKSGTTSRYLSIRANFHGKFTSFMPIDHILYDQQKKAALAKKRKGRFEQKWHQQRDLMWYLFYKMNNMSHKDIASEMERVNGEKVNPKLIEFAINNLKRKLEHDTYEDSEVKIE